MPISPSVRLGDQVVIFHPELVNLYGCAVGDETRIGAFVEIQAGASVGRRCKISSHSFICEGVTIEDGVFVGHGVMFTNDRFPRATRPDGSLQTAEDWVMTPTLVKKGASIGSGATIVCGVTIGENAMIGAGAVVTRDVPDNALAMGVPARVVGEARTGEETA
ncbi:MAG: acyltransferase [Thermodesulfobacteriota bacterium]